MHVFAFAVAALLLACIGVGGVRDALVARASKAQGTEASSIYFVTGGGAAPSAVVSAGNQFNNIEDTKYATSVAIAVIGFAGAATACAGIFKAP